MNDSTETSRVVPTADPPDATGFTTIDAHRLEQRLADLRVEHLHGQEVLARLESETADVRAQMLRISGAMQVLEELLHGAPLPS